MAQLFRITGTARNGKHIDDVAKIGGGRLDEQGVLNLYAQGGKYRGAANLKAQYLGEDNTPAINEQGIAQRPGPLVQPAASSAPASSSSTAIARPAPAAPNSPQKGPALASPAPAKPAPPPAATGQ